MSHVLVTFGFLWMIVATFAGLFLAKSHLLTQADLEKLAADGDLLKYHQLSERYKWRKHIHAHTFLYSILAVVIGLVIPGTAFAPVAVDTLVWALIISVIFWTGGALRSYRLLMIIGDIGLLGSILTVVVGLVHAL